jgi:hypothetical protein
MPTTAPLKPLTSAQIRALWAIARARGLSRDELHAAAGVASLKELSVSAAARLIDSLQTASHKREWQPGPPDRTARGALRLASERQRNQIQALFDELGWPADKARGWLAKRGRFAIHDLAAGAFSSRTATALVLQLRAIARKGGRDEAPEEGAQSPV